MYSFQTLYLEQKYGETKVERNNNKKVLWKKTRNSGNENVVVYLIDNNVPFTFELDTFFEDQRAYLKLNITFIGCGQFHNILYNRYYKKNLY